MRYRKLMMTIGLLAVFCMAMPVSQVLAVADPGTRPTGTITGPDVWGVVVITGSSGTSTLRVKQIDDCDVYTEAVTLVGFECPINDEAGIQYYVLPPQIKLHDKAGNEIGPDGASLIIMKVKNYQVDPINSDVCSFDALINFIK